MGNWFDKFIDGEAVASGDDASECESLFVKMWFIC
jgi:hypothetical protein